MGDGGGWQRKEAVKVGDTVHSSNNGNGEREDP